MDRQRASIDGGLESSKTIDGQAGCPNQRTATVDLYLAGFTLDQQRQAGDSSAVQRRWGKTDRQKRFVQQEVGAWRDVRKDADHRERWEPESP
jgi:hypothetical protein